MNFTTLRRRLRLLAQVAGAAILLVSSISECFAQAASSGLSGPAGGGVAVSSSYAAGALPPLDVPLNRLPARDPSAIAIDGWLLYPSLRTYTTWSDNVFFSPVGSINAAGLGVNPALTAVWTNGIHTTILYGDLDRQTFPTENQINTLDGRAGFTHRYEAMRDLIFTVNGNFSHQTWAAGLQNSLQIPSATPTILPNGNTVSPTGAIISPSGQPTGQVVQASGSNVPLSVDPYTQYTGTFSVDKIFNRGILSVSESLSRTDYDSNLVLGNFKSKTLTENAGAWLGPLLYAYSSGSYGTIDSAGSAVSPNSNSSTSYRIVGGLGTRQLGLWRGSMYFGHQGSEISNVSLPSTTAGGDVYGGALFYYPTPRLALSGTIDRTVNISSQASPTNLALTLPNFAAVQVPLTDSTSTTAVSLLSTYEFTQQWFGSVQLGFVRTEYVETPRTDDSWIVDATLRYNVRKNLSVTWEYRYRSIESNAALVSASSNFVMMGTTYGF
jgi:Putative beta-barrel porin 2